MSEDIETLSPTTTNEATARAADDRASAPRRAGSRGAWLIALIALGVGGVALWRAYAIEHGQADAQAAARTELVARIEAMTPLRRLAEPSDVAASIAFLVSPAAAMITGHVLAVDGGFLAQ